MAKKLSAVTLAPVSSQMTPLVAATLAGVIYQSKLLNRQAKLNIPEEEIISDVIGLWRIVMDVLSPSEK